MLINNTLMIKVNTFTQGLVNVKEILEKETKRKTKKNLKSIKKKRKSQNRALKKLNTRSGL